MAAIRGKIDLMCWLLEFVRYINAHGEYCLTKHDNSEIEVIVTVNKMSRIFFCVSDEKIHTFHFPFSIREDNQNKMFAVFYKDIRLCNEMITVFFALLESIEELRISLESALDLFVNTVAEFEIQAHEHSSYWQLFIFLLEFEPGYLRYDIDNKRCDQLHPLHHLDINYESAGTFKLGLCKSICCEKLADILDITSMPWSVSS